MSAPTPSPMSPAQAARVAKVDRKTIMRAIEGQRLRAYRDNRNQWQIDAEALRVWIAAQGARSGRPGGRAHPVAHPGEPSAALKLAALRERLEGVERARDVAERDRDAWRDQAATADRNAEAWRERVEGAEKGREAAERERDALRERVERRRRWWWQR